MIIHFLSLGRLCAKQGSTCKAKIRTFFVHFPSNKEVFLLRTDRAGNSLYTVIAEQSEYTNSLLVKCFHRTKQRSFLIKSMSIIWTESSRNTQCFTLDKCIRARIPCSISSRLKCGAKTAAWKRRCVRLTFNKFFTRKFHNYTAIRWRSNKTIVLLCGDTR